jgi:hypothetical protein
VQFGGSSTVRLDHVRRRTAVCALAVNSAERGSVVQSSPFLPLPLSATATMSNRALAALALVSVLVGRVAAVDPPPRNCYRPFLDREFLGPRSDVPSLFNWLIPY